MTVCPRQHDVLDMRVATAGFSAGIPYLGLLIVTLVASFVVDSILQRGVRWVCTFLSGCVLVVEENGLSTVPPGLCNWDASAMCVNVVFYAVCHSYSPWVPLEKPLRQCRSS